MFFETYGFQSAFTSPCFGMMATSAFFPEDGFHKLVHDLLIIWFPFAGFISWLPVAGSICFCWAVNCEQSEQEGKFLFAI